ncbi:hypothetical protein SDRG_13130 [Saprolegnia diclina VS20]|uniref:Uncharacterized protein n=1 Tax=Saprolegnia diclina (strain VS20) TaxID=1156394 RepID=T0PUB0_SAPDV|nr:hypothetical protein SDRG_13130 [Saprolegnia diclina VS20]EQC29099.1 hypothetical protein SDRG_13130 [Saprolegnia diclina VS20]|eukprot:XP_008617434.1 hypothetical protein SDRG_13130 [Saprolegnia diclina VS20]
MDHYIKRESPPAFDAPPSAPSAPSAPVEALADAALLPAPVEALAAMAAAPAPPATNDVQFLAQAVAGLFFVTDFAYMSMTGGFESMRLKLTDVQATLDMHLRIRYLDTELFATMRTELVTHRLLIATLFALVFALWYNPSTPI